MADVDVEGKNCELLSPPTSPIAPGTPISPGRKWFCHECHNYNSEEQDLCYNCHHSKPETCPESPGILSPRSPKTNRRRKVVKDVSDWVHEGLSSRERAPSGEGPKLFLRQTSSSSDNAKRDYGSRSPLSDRFALSGYPSPRDASCPFEFYLPDSSQSVIIFDWDDTLFPTTELFDEWGFSSRSEVPAPILSEDRRLGLQQWQSALTDYLETACSLSDCVAIVTSSHRPWVETCIERFAPNLTEMFARTVGGPIVIYAEEALPNDKKLFAQSMDLRPVHHRQWDLNLNQEEWEEELTAAKGAAIRLVLTEYYSQHPGRRWNVVSLGDMRYEHDATQEATFMNCNEQCYTKTILVPTSPSLSEITLRLRFSRLMLPEYLYFQGDIDLDLQTADDPLEAIGMALNMRELASLSVSRHAWGRTKAPNEGETKDALAELATTLESLLLARRAREAGVRWAIL